MTKSGEEYEFARKIIKREKKNPNPWSSNRRTAVINRIEKEFGQRGVKEFLKEFKKDYRLK